MVFLDYMSLYKKISNKAPKTYSLDFIAKENLGNKKIEFSNTNTIQFIDKSSDYYLMVINHILNLELLLDKLEDN